MSDAGENRMASAVTILKSALSFYWIERRSFLAVTIPYFLYLSARGSMSISFGLGNEILLTIVDFLVMLFLPVILARIIVTADEGFSESGYVSMARSFGMAWPILVVYSLSWLAIIGGMALFVIPGIYLSLAIQFIFYILFSRHINGIASLSTGVVLVRDYWFDVLWKVIFLSLFIGLVSFGAFLVALFISFNFEIADSQFFMIVMIIQFAVNSFFALPLTAIYNYGIYKELILVKDFDFANLDIVKEKKVLIIFAMIGLVVMLVLAVLLPFARMSYSGWCVLSENKDSKECQIIFSKYWPELPSELL